MGVQNKLNEEKVVKNKARLVAQDKIKRGD